MVRPLVVQCLILCVFGLIRVLFLCLFLMAASSAMHEVEQTHQHIVNILLCMGVVQAVGFE